MTSPYVNRHWPSHAIAARGESPASHRGRRGAPLTRRDDREYREYLREEQRSQRGCIAGRMQRDFHHGLLGHAAARSRRESRYSARHDVTDHGPSLRYWSHCQPSWFALKLPLTISSSRTGVSSTARAAPGTAATSPFAATRSRASLRESMRRRRGSIDAGGKAIAPGFIDIHTHARRGIFEVPTADNYVRQGVTTLMEGPDGGSPIPLRAVPGSGGGGPHHAELRQLRRTGIGPRPR